jgi:hypothetical protein
MPNPVNEPEAHAYLTNFYLSRNCAARDWLVPRPRRGRSHFVGDR